MLAKIIFIIGIVSFIFNIPLVSAQDKKSLPKAAYFDYAFKEFGAFSGFHWGTLKNDDKYEVIPTMLHFGFDLRPLIKNKSNILFEFSLEPFINTVIDPDYNAEIGNNFLLKFAFPLKARFYPYIEGGCGIIYLTQHTKQQATQFNFTDQAGVGITYFLEKNLSFSLGYRFRHISNASIKTPNNGIDSNSVIFGISFFY